VVSKKDGTLQKRQRSELPYEVKSENGNI